jgi:hypothetical protein
MPAIYRFLGTHEVLLYILLSIGAMFALRWLWRSWNEWRHAVYNLEKEFALRRIGQSVASLALIMALFLGELITATFIIPICQPHVHSDAPPSSSLRRPGRSRRTWPRRWH